MQPASYSFNASESPTRAEERIERLVTEISREIQSAEPSRRAELKELAETLLHEEIVTIAEEPVEARPEGPRKRANPLAAGLLLALLGLGLAIIVPFVGLTLAAIGFCLVLWGGVISWLRK
jgi:hypothetical protein